MTILPMLLPENGLTDAQTLSRHFAVQTFIRLAKYRTNALQCV